VARVEMVAEVMAVDSVAVALAVVVMVVMVAAG